MKKIIFIFTFFILLSPLISAKSFFSERYFEMNVYAPVSVSNNAFSVKDIFQKEIVIDLKELANSLPKNGLNSILKFSPCYSINVRTPKVHVGLSVGFDLYDKFSLSKDLFDFLGNGNQIGVPTTVSITNDADFFIHSDITVGIKNNGSNLVIKPSIFIPLATTSGEIGKISFVNNDDGTIHMNLSSSANVYSYLDFSKVKNDPASILNNLNAEMIKKIGFDLDVSYMKQVNSDLTIGGNIHFPIVPGRITNLINYKYDCDVDFSASDIANLDSNIFRNTSEIETEYNNDVMLKVNRPLKMMGMLNYVPFNSIFLYEVGLGFGIHHPFVEGSYAYFEYYLASSIHLGGFFETKLSTEYTDQVFKHQLQTKLNLRLVELDLGFSFESSTFAKSFSASGFGAFVSVSAGI